MIRLKSGFKGRGQAELVFLAVILLLGGVLGFIDPHTHLFKLPFSDQMNEVVHYFVSSIFTGLGLLVSWFAYRHQKNGVFGDADK